MLGGFRAVMQRGDKRRLKEFYENEAERLSHQKMMYLKAEKHELWWHRKRLYYVISYLSEIFGEGQMKTFVDVGCAEGFYVKYVASSHSETFCIGADVARAYVKKAKTNVNALNSDYVVCDVERLPFRNSGIDAVLCSEVLEHVHNYLGSLSELNRVVKKYLVLSFPGHSYLYQIMSRIRIAKNFADSLVPDVGHVSEVQVSKVREFLKGKYESLKIRIGGSLPIMVFKIVPSIRLVDIIDDLICKVLEYFDAIDYATIHVMEIMKGES